MGVRQLLRNVQEGKIGRNVGISTGMPTIDSVIYGIQRKYLYTIGADTSGGKTSFAVDVFVYNLIKNAGPRPISILYYSFEMSSDILFAKMLSLHIFDRYGEIVTYEDISELVWKGKVFSIYSLRNVVKHIREKTDGTFIQNSSNRGYILNAI